MDFGPDFAHPTLVLGLVLIVLAVVLGGLGLIVLVTSRAPLGYQDDQGFHYGPEAQKPVDNLPGAVPEPGR